MKETMLQTFQWYEPADGSFWKQLKEKAPGLAAMGYTMAWLPPAYKGQAGSQDVGYGVYDLYDLGEFDQKGTIATKYGTKAEYEQAIAALKENGIKVISDIVLNHRMGADEKETVTVIPVNGQNRDEPTAAPYQTEVWTKFTFPGRSKAYSDFEWDWTCFTGTDWDAGRNQNGILLFDGKHWNSDVSKEQGNFDYIMGADVDTNNPAVQKELYEWGKWYQDISRSDGYRLDAIKSIDFDFFKDWLAMMDREGQHEHPFAVGEYWSGDLEQLKAYLHECSFSMHLFDVPLHYHLMEASRANGNYDLRRIFDNTLYSFAPDYAVPFVDNHDTQPSQALESWVLDWFKPHAYAAILLYKAKNACVFAGDLYGIEHSGNKPVGYLPEMVWLRKNLLGDEIIPFMDDDFQKAAWLSVSDHPIAVVMSIGDRKTVRLEHPSLKNRQLVNVLNPSMTASADDNGVVILNVDGGSCAVYILPEDLEAMNQALGK